MRPVVGLDLSLTSTGWATWIDGTLTTGRIRPKKLHGRERRRWIADTIDDRVLFVPGFPLVVIEAVPTRGARDIVALGLLHGVVLDVLRRRPAYVMPTELKRWVTADQKASKTEMLRFAQAKLGLTSNSDDEADAAWLTAVGRLLLGDTTVPLVAPPDVPVGAVTWPEGLDYDLGGVE